MNAATFNHQPKLRVRVALMVALILAGANSSESSEPSRELSFNRDIRPVLSDKCFQCHGPDAQARKADLRLDQFGDEDGVNGAESILVPGDVDASEIVRRITCDDDDERMPPASATRQLTSHQIELLKRWVSQGANYESHWAFVATTRPQLPAVKNTGWPQNGIDYFVLARLEREHLVPSPPTGLATIMRRASLDLIGLPADIKSLSAIGNEQSYAQFVDRLLVSPRYGEHWATMWLDAARYADTNGYNNDTPRYNWKYRDWVIQALNHNMPYDHFVTEQLAGDLLPDATIDQQIASGFNRNHNVTSEGGIIDEEYRLEYVADRVHTTSTVFMALQTAAVVAQTGGYLCAATSRSRNRSLAA